MCCVALALLVAFVRRVASVLVPRLRHPLPTPLPPAARRAYGHEVDGPGGRTVAAVRGAPMQGSPGRGRGPAPKARATPLDRERLGWLLIIGGLGWFAAGIVLMHGLGIAPAAVEASALLDLVFHGSGPLVASVGLLVRAPSIRQATIGLTS